MSMIIFQHDFPETKVFPEAYGFRCLSGDTRISRLLWAFGYRRRAGVFYLGRRPSNLEVAEILGWWENNPNKGWVIVKRLAALVRLEPDPEYLKLFAQPTRVRS